MAKLTVAVDDGESETQVVIEKGNSIAMCMRRFVIWWSVSFYVSSILFVTFIDCDKPFIPTCRGITRRRSRHHDRRRQLGLRYKEKRRIYIKRREGEVGGDRWPCSTKMGLLLMNSERSKAVEGLRWREVCQTVQLRCVGKT